MRPADIREQSCCSRTVLEMKGEAAPSPAAERGSGWGCRQQPDPVATLAAALRQEVAEGATLGTKRCPLEGRGWHGTLARWLEGALSTPRLLPALLGKDRTSTSHPPQLSVSSHRAGAGNSGWSDLSAKPQSPPPVLSEAEHQLVFSRKK